MNYEGWMVSLYDLYREEYNDYYQIKKGKFLKRLKDSYKKGKIKGIFKEFLTFPNKLAMIGFIIYCIAEISALIPYFISIRGDNATMMFISMGLMVTPPIILISIGKFTIKGYEKCVIVLKNVLTRKGIGSTEKINILIKDSNNYLNKREKINSIAKAIQLSTPIIVVIIGNEKYRDAINNFISGNIEILSISIVIAVPVIVGYLIVTNRPEGRKQKIKELNYLLKITLLYM